MFLGTTLEDIGTALVAAAPVSWVTRNWKLRSLYIGIASLIPFVLANLILFPKDLEAIKKILINLAGGLLLLAIYNFILDKLLLNDGTLRINAIQRRRMDEQYRQMKVGARYKIYILATSLNDSINDFLRDTKLFKNITDSDLSLDIRLVFVSPNSEVIKDRAREDGRSESIIKGRINSTIKKSVLLYDRIIKLMEQGKKSNSTISVKITNVHPLHSLVIIDDKPIHWTVHTLSKNETLESVISVPLDNDPVYTDFLRHFDSVWSDPSTVKVFEIDLKSKAHKLEEELLNSLYSITPNFDGKWRNTVKKFPD